MGSRRDLARLITQIENNQPSARRHWRRVSEHGGAARQRHRRARRSKSTLVSEMAKAYRGLQSDRGHHRR